MSHSLDVLASITANVPDRLVRLVLARAEGAAQPVPPRLSASVILLRERDGVLQTYLLHRHARMAFAASVVAFPGGGLEPVDQESSDPVLACGLRELAEETGISVPGSALFPWAHWITPEAEPRRYDTRFYVVIAPDDQEPADISSEASAAGWETPAAALDAFRRDDLSLLPPTQSILVELAELGSVTTILAAARDRVVETVLPVPERVGDQWRFRYPRREES